MLVTLPLFGEAGPRNEESLFFLILFFISPFGNDVLKLRMDANEAGKQRTFAHLFNPWGQHDLAGKIAGLGDFAEREKILDNLFVSEKEIVNAIGLAVRFIKVIPLNGTEHCLGKFQTENSFARAFAFLAEPDQHLGRQTALGDSRHQEFVEGAVITLLFQDVCELPETPLAEAIHEG